jgi:hypothetical protein
MSATLSATLSGSQTVNKEAFYRVADAIEQENLVLNGDGPIKFNMNSFADKTDCGTTACVAGMAVALYNPTLFKEYLNATTEADWMKTQRDLIETAKRVLGLESDDLFYAKELVDDTSAVQERRAFVPAALRWMAGHNDPDWYRALDAVGTKPVAYLSDDED